MNYDLSDLELEFNYPDPIEDKRDKKRRQNRASAARNRARKKLEAVQIEESCVRLEEVHSQLTVDNVALKTENEMLKKELEFYRGILHNTKPSAPARPGFWALSLVCALSLMCLAAPSTELISTGGRRLLSLSTGSQPDLWIMSLLVVVGLCLSVLKWPRNVTCLRAQV
jgi:hypothetical protein